jgi:hypothetical protein
VTIFGTDISSFQSGLDLSTLSDASFILAKTTEGTYYTDRNYQGWRRQAAQLGKLFCWYHFLSGEDAHAQVQHTIANVGDAGLPGMLDVEPEGAFTPTLAQTLAYVDAAHAGGLLLRLVYLPEWVWRKMGAPDLRPLAARGVYLVSSAYPGGSGSAVQEYPGDGAPGWLPYGGLTPLLYQFTDNARDGGQALDFNAYRGTAASLAASLAGSTPTSNSGDPMATYTMSAGWQADYPDVAPALEQHIPVGTVIDDGDAAAYAMIRSFVAAERAAAIEAKVDALAAKLGAPTVDVNGLAAALGPLLHPTTDVDALTAALLPHLPGSPDPVAFADALIAHVKVVP